MNRDQWLDELAQKARQERPPSLDVQAEVLRRIRSARTGLDMPTAVATGTFSAAAAIALMMYAGQAWSTWQDPMTELLVSMSMVMQ